MNITISEIARTNDMYALTVVYTHNTITITKVMNFSSLEKKEVISAIKKVADQLIKTFRVYSEINNEYVGKTFAYDPKTGVLTPVVEA